MQNLCFPRKAGNCVEFIFREAIPCQESAGGFGWQRLYRQPREKVDSGEGDSKEQWRMPREGWLQKRGQSRVATSGYEFWGISCASGIQLV